MNVLVDLSNTAVYRGIQRPNPSVVGARLDALLEEVSMVLRKEVAGRDLDMSVRLYDGWYDVNGRPTEIEGLTRKHLRMHYPTRTRSTRIRASIADSPAATPSARLSNTFRTSRGFERSGVSLAGSAPASCANPLDCSINELRRWFKGSCPHQLPCSTTSVEIAESQYQKLVDTCITADAVWFAANGEPVAVVSEDEDVVPGLLTASAFESPVFWVNPTTGPREPYRSHLASQKVVHCQC